ncbi:MAG: hypothetical protein M1817_001235 [Caeruleum heppii]|nr:MAG: hypothetical protein M1817_001235 [Caeruleum heppii]
MAPKQVLVLGAGVIGLQISLALLEAGYDVTVIARHLPGDEDVEDHPTPDTADDSPSLWWRSKVRFFRRLPASDLPDGVDSGLSFRTFCFNVPKYLEWLQARVVGRRGRIIRATLPTDEGLAAAIVEAAAAASDQENGNVCNPNGTNRFYAVINATGLGARDLVPDPTVYPIRGQTVLVRGEATSVHTRFGTLSPDAASPEPYPAYVIPRPGSGTTVLGGCMQPHDEDPRPDPEMTAAILRRCRELAPELLDETGAFEVLSEQVGLRPAREEGPRVESEGLVVEGRRVRVVHCYGHAGGGYQNSIGCAAKVRRLLADEKSMEGSTSRT